MYKESGWEFVFSLLLVSIVNAEIAEFGACFQTATNAHRCAINSASCISSIGETWLKPFELNFAMGRITCNCEDSHIGHCLPRHGERGNCAMEQESCPADQGFDDNLWFYNDGGTCMCHGMTGHPYSSNVIELEKTLYGACVDGSDVRCSVHSNQCEIGERWLSPQELETIGYSPCTCDKVRVGSCNSPFKLQCVVDSESCEDEVDFISSYITKAQGNDCFLCSADVLEVDVELGVKDDIVDKNVDLEDDVFDSFPENYLGGDLNPIGGFDTIPEMHDDGGKAADDSKADDDDRKADDDDGKNDDDDTRSSKAVSQTTFAVTLAFMIFGLTIALILSVYIVLTSRKSKDNDVDTKSTNGSVV